MIRLMSTLFVKPDPRFDRCLAGQVDLLGCPRKGRPLTSYVQCAFGNPVVDVHNSLRIFPVENTGRCVRSAFYCDWEIDNMEHSVNVRTSSITA